MPLGKGCVDTLLQGSNGLGDLSLVVTGFLSALLAQSGGDQADRAISKAQLHALLHFHMPPIVVVVYQGS